LILDRLITCTYFRNDKVEEDDTSQSGDDEPDYPEECALEGLEYLLSIKLKVSHRDSHYGEKVACKLADMHILFSCISDAIK
jgi:hypothetical protein